MNPRQQKVLEVGKIIADSSTQAREHLDQSTVAEYAEAIDNGSALPPAVVFHDGSSYWLADGFHRLEAEKRSQRGGMMQCEVRPGTQRDARLFSSGANAAHGLRRTNSDKRRAVQMLLDDPEWSEWSDRKIARHCAVSQPFVSGMRHEVITVITPDQGGGDYAQTGQDGTNQDGTGQFAVAGRQDAAQQAPEQPAEPDLQEESPRASENRSPIGEAQAAPAGPSVDTRRDRPAGEPQPQLTQQEQEHVDRIGKAVHRLSLDVGKARGALGNDHPLIEGLAPVVGQAKRIVADCRRPSGKTVGAGSGPAAAT